MATTKRPYMSRKPTRDLEDLQDSTFAAQWDRKYSQQDIKEPHEDLTKAKDSQSVELSDEEKEIVKRVATQLKERARGKKIHKRFQDVTFKPGNTAFDRHNPERTGSFHGFFALFWLGLAFLWVKTSLQHWRSSGHFFSTEVATMYQLNGKDLIITDAVMVSSSVFVVLLQKVVLAGLSWNRFGWLIENVWQAAYLGIVIHRSYTGDWQWIQSVVIVLHCFVMLMKQHSYATYMGYLSEIYKTKRKLERKLIHLRKNQKFASKLTSGPPSPDPVEERSDVESIDSNSTLADNLGSQGEEEKSLVAHIDDLAEELTHDGVTYPENLSFANYVDYLLVPSLVYDIVYPRTKHVRGWYVFEKTLATLGTFGLMTMVVEHYVLPVLPKDLATMTTNQKLAELPWLMLDMVFPFITLYLLTFYIIFECVCQWFAEVTRFADRNFYNDWWNSLSWENFARDWNVPVHRFLLRHVYHSSMSVLDVKKKEATIITFFLSSVVHEVVMACMTKKIRFYLLGSQMLQLPLVGLMNTQFFKKNPAAANVFFWFGLFCGPSFLCLAYVLF